METSKFSFRLLPNKSFPSMESRETRYLLEKWYMKGRMKLVSFFYDQHFQSYEKEAFARDFFASPCVREHFFLVPHGADDSWRPVRSNVARIEVENVACTITSMSFFDRLKTEGVIRESGSIRKCLDEYRDGFQIADELRRVLLVDDSDNYEIFDESDRDEFIFRIFRHFCLGGAVCQYEDDVQPYFETTKNFYHDVVSVAKDPDTKKLSIVSRVFRVECYGDEGDYVFPGNGPHEQNICYLIVDMVKRHVTAWYHDFGQGIM